MTESMVFALKMSVVGVFVVFVSLAFIAILIGFMRRLDDNWSAREDSQKAEQVNKEATIDELTIVLISAAVATILKGRTRIRSIHRVQLPGGLGSSNWSMQGRTVLHGSHKMEK